MEGIDGMLAPTYLDLTWLGLTAWCDTALYDGTARSVRVKRLGHHLGRAHTCRRHTVNITALVGSTGLFRDLPLLSSTLSPFHLCRCDSVSHVCACLVVYGRPAVVTRCPRFAARVQDTRGKLSYSLLFPYQYSRLLHCMFLGFALTSTAWFGTRWMRVYEGRLNIYMLNHGALVHFCPAYYANATVGRLSSPMTGRGCWIPAASTRSFGAQTIPTRWGHRAVLFPKRAHPSAESVMSCLGGKLMASFFHLMALCFSSIHALYCTVVANIREAGCCCPTAAIFSVVGFPTPSSPLSSSSSSPSFVGGAKVTIGPGVTSGQLGTYMDAKERWVSVPSTSVQSMGWLNLTRFLEI